MGSKTVRLDDDVYERLREQKRDDETFSDAIERMLPKTSLRDLVGAFEGVEVERIEGELEAQSRRTHEQLDDRWRRE